jgi:hypothetical protein
LRQAEIISGLVQYEVNSATGEAPNVTHEFCIILSQDCDLLRDYESRRAGNAAVLNGVLIYEAEIIEQFRPKFNSGLWKPVRNNVDERYHLLEEVPVEKDLAGGGIPSLGIDFRRFFTMPSEEIERQCAAGGGAVRRCRMEAPYREHLQARAAFYLQRVMLPLRHLNQ